MGFWYAANTGVYYRPELSNNADFSFFRALDLSINTIDIFYGPAALCKKRMLAIKSTVGMTIPITAMMRAQYARFEGSVKEVAINGVAVSVDENALLAALKPGDNLVTILFFAHAVMKAMAVFSPISGCSECRVPTARCRISQRDGRCIPPTTKPRWWICPSPATSCYCSRKS